MTAAPHVTPAEIKTVRKLKGWTQQEMADELGYAHELSVSFWERDTRVPGPTARVQIAEWMEELKAAGRWPKEKGEE